MVGTAFMQRPIKATDWYERGNLACICGQIDRVRGFQLSTVQGGSLASSLSVSASPARENTMAGFIINVDHWPDSKFVTVSGFGKHKRPDDFFCQYTIGKMKPNYPMPAIPIEIEYLNGAVMVCEMNNPDYKYGLITLYPHN